VLPLGIVIAVVYRGVQAIFVFDAPVEHDDSEGYYAGIVSGVGWLDCLKLGVNISFLGGNSYVFCWTLGKGSIVLLD